MKWALLSPGTRAQITAKSSRRHEKDSQAGKGTLLPPFSTYSGYCIILPIHSSHVRIIKPWLTVSAVNNNKKCQL